MPPVTLHGARHHLEFLMKDQLTADIVPRSPDPRRHDPEQRGAEPRTRIKLNNLVRDPIAHIPCVRHNARSWGEAQ